MRRGARAVTAALTVGLGAVALAGPAEADGAAITCGSVVEGTVVLTTDLVCKDSEVGIELGPNSTLDLAGHRIVGGGSGVGVLVRSFGSARVTGGVIRGWGRGIAPIDPGQYAGEGVLHVEGMTLRGNDVAVWMPSMAAGEGDYAMRVRLTESRVADNRLGLRVTDIWGTLAEPGVRITSSQLVDNASAVEVAATTTVIADTVFAHNDQAFSCEEARCPITDSTFRDNGAAVVAHYYGRLAVERTTFARNETAVDVYWEPYETLELVDSAFRDNGTALRILDAVAYVGGNVFRRNGVAFEASNQDWPELTVQLVGNEFRRNGDGVLSVPAGSEVGDNTAVRNERWGIHAPGAVDLGGNTARGNGNEPQCVGVVCTAPGSLS